MACGVCVLSGSIMTDLFKESIASQNMPLKTAEDLYPMKRVGEPHEVAELVQFLASDKAAFMTATHFVIDGGIMSLGGWAPKDDLLKPQ